MSGDTTIDDIINFSIKYDSNLMLTINDDAKVQLFVDSVLIAEATVGDITISGSTISIAFKPVAAAAAKQSDSIKKAIRKAAEDAETANISVVVARRSFSIAGNDYTPELTYNYTASKSVAEKIAVATDIQQTEADATSHTYYNIGGQQTTSDSKGIVISRGKKIYQK